MNKTYLTLCAGVLLSAFALSSCESPQTTREGAKKGAIYGGAAGLLKGAVDGKEGNVLKSGAIGAGIGAGTGAAIGNRNEKRGY
tara:strand:- start:32929 stop:33180 length:252 start_codon:yes stop_codon:yes gene_type:complete